MNFMFKTNKFSSALLNKNYLTEKNILFLIVFMKQKAKFKDRFV